MTVERRAASSSIRGSRANPYTDGVLCAKVPERATRSWVHGPGRLHTPLRRVGAKGEGRFERISWDEALDADPRPRQHGHRRARAAGRRAAELRRARTACSPAPRWTCASSIGWAPPCSTASPCAAASAPRRGSAPTARRPASRRSRSQAEAHRGVGQQRHVVEPAPHAADQRRRAARGGKLVVIDPKRTKIAEQADLHIALRPGTDVVLAWAIAAELERRGGARPRVHRAARGGLRGLHGAGAPVSRRRGGPDLRGARGARSAQLAEWYTRDLPRPSASATGSSATRTAAAASARCSRCPRSPASGAWWAAGWSTAPASRSPRRRRKPRASRPRPGGNAHAQHRRHGPAPYSIPTLAPPHQGPVHLQPQPGRSCTPIRTGCKRGPRAARTSSRWACDVVMTDSLAYCDIVLPAWSHFEYPDLYAAYGTHWLQRAEPVIPPQGESLPNTEIFRRLAARFGFTEPAFTASDAELMDDAMDPADARIGACAPSQLPLDEALAMTRRRRATRCCSRNVPPGRSPARWSWPPRTSSEKYGARLPSYRPIASRLPADPHHAGVGRAHHLDLRRPSGQRRGPRRSRCTRTTRGRGTCRTGSPSACGTTSARCACRFKITDAVPPRRGLLAQGRVVPTSDNGQTVSRSRPRTTRTSAEGACYNDARVEVALAT